MKLPALFEIGVGLAGESHHDVGADGGVRHQRARFEDAVGVMARPVLAVHAAKRAVAAALQRGVDVLRDARRWRP